MPHHTTAPGTMPVTEHLNEIVRCATAAGCGVPELFRRAGMHITTWYAWRRGSRYPSLRSMERLRQAAGHRGQKQKRRP